MKGQMCSLRGKCMNEGESVCIAERLKVPKNPGIPGGPKRAFKRPGAAQGPEGFRNLARNPAKRGGTHEFQGIQREPSSGPGPPRVRKAAGTPGSQAEPRNSRGKTWKT